MVATTSMCTALLAKDLNKTPYLFNLPHLSQERVWKCWHQMLNGGDSPTLPLRFAIIWSPNLPVDYVSYKVITVDDPITNFCDFLHCCTSPTMSYTPWKFVAINVSIVLFFGRIIGCMHSCQVKNSELFHQHSPVPFPSQPDIVSTSSLLFHKILLSWNHHFCTLVLHSWPVLLLSFNWFKYIINIEILL